MQLDGKVVLISGANGGLGNAVTNAFLDAGALVAGLAPVIQDSEFPHPHFVEVPADLSGLESAHQALDTVLAKWRRIDVLVHLVGGFTGGKSVAETDDASLDHMLTMNFRTAFNLIRAVLPGMRARGSGRIVAIGSRTAVEPAAMLGVYSASKAALVSLVRTVALENKDRGITANVVLPGTMDTPANRAAMPTADASKWVPPAQVAALLVHLASDQASQISGSVIPILGGDL